MAVSEIGNQIGQFANGIINPLLGSATQTLGGTTTTETTKTNANQKNYVTAMWIIGAIAVIGIGVALYFTFRTKTE